MLKFETRGGGSYNLMTITLDDGTEVPVRLHPESSTKALAEAFERCGAGYDVEEYEATGVLVLDGSSVHVAGASAAGSTEDPATTATTDGDGDE